MRLFVQQPSVRPTVATATLTFNETVPLKFRPASTNGMHVSVGVIQNGVEVIATISIGANGVVSIGLGSGLGTFTIAQNCAFLDGTRFGTQGVTPI